MFDNMKMLGALGALMKNQDKLRDAGARVREKMASTRVWGESGSGAVRAQASGEMRITALELAPGLVAGMAADDKTRALAGSLIADAVNHALDQAQARLREAVDAEAKALGLDGALPGMGALLGGR